MIASQERKKEIKIMLKFFSIKKKQNITQTHTHKFSIIEYKSQLQCSGRRRKANVWRKKNER